MTTSLDSQDLAPRTVRHYPSTINKEVIFRG